MILEFTLPFPPSSNRYWRTTRNGRIYVSAEAKDYREAASELLTAYRHGLAGKLRLELFLFPPNLVRWDVSNRIKILEDVLEICGVIANDRFVDDIRAVREDPVGKRLARAEVRVTQLSADVARAPVRASRARAAKAQEVLL